MKGRAYGQLTVGMLVMIILLTSSLMPSHARHGGGWSGYAAQAEDEASPPAYVQEEPQPQDEPAPEYWYYCQSAQAYYPDVQECPSGWLQVVPQPSPPQR